MKIKLSLSKLKLQRLSPLFLKHLYSVSVLPRRSYADPRQRSLPPRDEFVKYCYEKDLPKAMRALEVMQKLGVWADSVTYSELLKCCLARGALREGKLIYKHVFSGGYEPKTFLINMFINMFVKFDLLKEAQALFDEMLERNVISWTTMISAYVNAKIGRKALELLVLMIREGVTPNMYTFSSVLRACDELLQLRQIHCSALKLGLESDVYVRSALIDVYSKLGKVADALHAFNEMETGDLVVWNSVIAGFTQNGDSNEAVNQFKRMKETGFLADQSTLTSVLSACTRLSLLEVGRQVHVHVLKFNHDLILNNALLDMYCKCGCLEDAKSLFGRMSHTDTISWSTMIGGLAQNGFSREALEMFKSMKASGRKPNYITMIGVLFACSHAGLVEDGLYYFRSMKRLFEIDPGREHYGCMIDLLGRAGKLEEAIKLIHEMPCQPDAVTWRALLGACRVHRNVDLAVYAANRAIGLDPEDAGTYIQLSNIYAKSQRWHDVTKIRKTMEEKGIKKDAGCSWVEVNKEIHAFIVGDSNHPQGKEINERLDMLFPELMRLGYVPDTNFVMQDIEEEQGEDSLRYHSEKLAIAFGLMHLPRETAIRIRKNLRICGDCHTFGKLVSKLEDRLIVIRDPIRYHHFQHGLCSCGDYW